MLLRYRGYYYDNETGFYYLNARYYDPIVHRFISPEPNFRFGEIDKEAGLSAYNVYRCILLWGPYGAANLRTIWEKGKLITVYLYK